ncbi:hypothetical protein JCM10207_003630 [Rhodosporidiobolus poonsookiae]
MPSTQDDRTPSPRPSTYPPSPFEQMLAAHPPATPRLFDLAHSRGPHATGDLESNHIHYRQHVAERDAPLSWRHYFSRPVIRQWTLGDILVCEQEERASGSFELFFDLMFVAIVSKLAEQVNQSNSAWSIFVFCTFFWLAWTMWNDARHYINISGTNDVSSRVYILVMIWLLVGFVANAIALNISCDYDTSTEDDYDDYFGETFVLPGGCYMEAGWLRSIRAALTFFLIARALRIGLLLIYGMWLPRFRRAHFIRAFAMTVGSCMWVPLTHVYAPLAFFLLPLIAFVLEILAQLVSTPLLQIATRRSRRSASKVSGSGSYALVPAINLEHSLDRTYAFVVLVLGEMVTSTMYEAAGEWAGVALVYLRAVCGLFIAFTVLWIYQEQAAARTFSSAMRRHWLTSTAWQLLHFPLCAGLILAAAETSSFVKEGHPEQKRRWIYAGGLSCVFLCLFLLGALHRPLDRRGSALLPRSVRLSARLLCAVLLALLPLAPLENVGAIVLLGVSSAALLLLLVLESVGQLGSVADPARLQSEVAHLAPHAHEEEEGGAIAPAMSAPREAASPPAPMREKTSVPPASSSSSFHAGLSPPTSAPSSTPSASAHLAHLLGVRALAGAESQPDEHALDLAPVERDGTTTGVESGLGELVVVRLRGGLSAPLAGLVFRPPPMLTHLLCFLAGLLGPFLLPPLLHRLKHGTAKELYDDTDAVLLNAVEAKSRWFNMGYWTRGGQESFPEAAAEHCRRVALAGRLTSHQRVLEVGYGSGDSTLLLSREFSPAQYVGVTSLAAQQALAQKRATEAGLDPARYTLLQGDGASLPGAPTFEDGSFDAVLGVDCAYHFSPRASFLTRAHALLAPGGSLALSDLLLPSSPLSTLDTLLLRCLCAVAGIPFSSLLPEAEYTAALIRAGFNREDIELEDISAHVWPGFIAFVERRERELGAVLSGRKWGPLKAYAGVVRWYAGLRGGRSRLRFCIVRARKAGKGE